MEDRWEEKEAPPSETHALAPANQTTERGIHQREEAPFTNQLHMSQVPCPLSPSPPSQLPAADKYDPHLTALVIPQLSFILHIINISSVKKTRREGGGRFLPCSNRYETTSLKSIKVRNFNTYLLVLNTAVKTCAIFITSGTIDRHIRNTCKKRRR